MVFMMCKSASLELYLDASLEQYFLRQLQTWSQTQRNKVPALIQMRSTNQRFGNHARCSIRVKYIKRSAVRVPNRIQSEVHLA